MLTKTKIIRKKKSKKKKKKKNVWTYGPGTATINLKELHTITSEIIDATDGRETNCDFKSSAEIVKQS